MDYFEWWQPKLHGNLPIETCVIGALLDLFTKKHPVQFLKPLPMYQWQARTIVGAVQILASLTAEIQCAVAALVDICMFLRVTHLESRR